MPARKLTDDQAREVRASFQEYQRRMAHAREVSPAIVGKQFGIHPRHVEKIGQGDASADVE